MNITGLLAQLNEKNVMLSLRGNELIVHGKKQALAPSLLTLLRENKKALVELIQAGEYIGPRQTVIDIPPNRIPLGCEAITPEMLPLVELSAAEIELIVSAVPGGAANVQDIYPLAPLQEGLLFHYLMVTEGDMYLSPTVFSFDSRARLDAYLQALQAVVERHDILRTAILWEGLPEPVQVVWRQAPLIVEEVSFDPAAGNITAQLYARFNPRHYRIDIRQAPLMRVHIAHDAASRRWVALWLSHHLSSDPTTLKVMVQEIEAHLLGQAEQLPPPLPFRNFVAQTRLGVSREEHEAFFRNMLACVDEPTAPFGLTDIYGDGSGIAEAGLEVDASLARRLRERARALSVSAASLFHLAWAQVLVRVSGQDDVVFGTVLFGRLQGGEGAGRVLGMFINTLPVRIRVGNDSVQDSVRQTHRLLTELLRHEHASLALAQRCSAVAAPAPLFSALLNYGRSPGVAPAQAQVQTQEQARTPQVLSEIELQVFEKRTNYALALNVSDLGEGFALNAQVQSPIDPERISAYMHTSLERLVEALERAPTTPVRSLDVLPASERQQLLVEWNATEAEYPRDKCIHELFEAQAVRTPDAIAVVHEDRQLSYGELDAQANRLAHYLHGLGVQPDTRVAVLIERSIELVLAELAILKCGAAYVPLDQNAPIERQSFMIEDCQASIMLTIKDLEAPANAGVRRINIDELTLTGHISHDVAKTPESEAPAYIMYTSGSTGQPKGVVIPHRAIGRLVINNGYAAFEASDRVAFAANPAFDASTMEVWAPLLHGGRVVVINQATLLAPDRFKHCLQSQAVNVLWLTVGLFNQYAEGLAEAFSCLRYLIVGGDALDPEVIARVLRTHPPRHLVNGYGPTETATFAITYEITEVPEGIKRIPIGRPIANTQVYVLDSHGEPVPVGVTGEIYIGGAGVAHGYLNRPDLTAERFVPLRIADCGLRIEEHSTRQPAATSNTSRDRESAIPESQSAIRVYKTGDLGRYLADGKIEFLGRNDFQVKIRGFRVELGEIETRLAQYPAIREAVVLAREDSPGDKRLVAYYTAVSEQGASTLSADVLRNYLLALLPEYMVPAAYVALDVLPLTPNGKLDRKALPVPEGEAYAAGGYEAPVGEIETKLAEIWAEVLKLERVGRHDDFFDLGGHSLLAVKVASRACQVLGVEVSVTDLFLHPVLTEFAQVVNDAAGSELPPITITARDQPLALSFAQQRLWFLAQMGGFSQAYHMPAGLRLIGELDWDALRRSLDAIVARHEALRTTFIIIDGAPVQRIAADNIGFALEQHDLSQHPDAEGELGRLTAEEARAAFDLETGPLIRGQLIKLGRSEHVLLITMHHIVSDGWSMGVLIRELSTLYRAFSEGQADPLPALTLQYADYAAWQRRWIAGDVLQAQTEYWQRTLAGAPVLLTLPTDRPRPAQQDLAGEFIRLELDGSLTAGLKALSQRHGTTLFMTLLAAWSMLLARLARQGEVVIGTPVANRTRAEVEPLIGFFVNTLALRLDLSGSPTVSQMLERVKAQTLGAQQHQDLPFEQVVEIAQPPRSLAHSPLFQVMFAWQNNEAVELELPGLVLAPVGAPHVMAKFDLTLELFEAGDCIIGGLIYATALFDRSTVERYLEYLRSVLQEMVANDGQAVDRLRMLSPSERHQLLVEWNATETGYRHDQCIHELFEVQVEKTPDAIAVVHEETHLTYGELNSQANRLAHYLRMLGVKPDARVALCMERSLDMVFGLLGILKASGVYVPLDPEYPAERLTYMLADSTPVMVLTHTLVQAEIRSALTRAVVPVIDLEADAGRWAEQPNINPDKSGMGLTPESLAYVIYTSGSTGIPKGVMNEHRGVLNRLLWMQDAYGLNPQDVVLQKTPFSFDVSVWEFFWPLLNGAKLVMARAEGHKDPAYLAEVIQKQHITTLHFVPSMLQVFLEYGAAAKCSSVARVICSGEALPGLLARRFQEQLSHSGLYNLYGPTEAAVDVTAWACTSEIHQELIPIGRPIANTQIYLLDSYGEPVPVGVQGEIYIGGVQVARGYLNRPELTAKRFVADPFSSEPGTRMYQTGDMGRYLAGGKIEFLGRNDFQVKLRGFRIELGEIEARLADHPAIREAVVLAREDTSGDQRLVAYYTVSTTEDIINAETLRAHLSAVLPEYMVPAAYVMLDALPLMPNGKLNRQALPAPEGTAYTVRKYEAPIGEIETRLAEIWAEVLKIERVGRHDHFFELGGHSLLVVRLVEHMRREGLHADVRTLFTTPRLAEMAAATEIMKEIVL